MHYTVAEGIHYKPVTMHLTELKISGDLRPHQNELHHLAQMAGLNMNPRIFRIIIEMLNIGVDARTIYGLFRTALKGRRNT